MDERNNTNENGHNFYVILFDKIGDGCRKLLRKLKYVVPDDFSYKKWWRFKLFCSFILPVVALVFSGIFFTIEPLYFIAIVVSVGYKTLTVTCEYNNYKQSGTGQGTSGLKPENPMLIRFIAIVAALIFIGVAISAHIFWPDDVTMQVVVIISGYLDILITCVLEIWDALVALYHAEPPNF